MGNGTPGSSGDVDGRLVGRAARNERPRRVTVAGAGTSPSSEPVPGPSAAPRTSPEQAPRPWATSYPPGVPEAYRWPDVGLSRLLDDAARDFPDVPAVRTHPGSWTWADVQEEVSGFAAALQRAGVRPGDRVGLAVGAGPAPLVVAFGAWQVGAILVLVPEAGPGERSRVLAAARPRVTVVPDDVAAAWTHVGHTVVGVGPGSIAPAGRLARWRLGRSVGRGGGPDAPAAGAPVAWTDFVADPGRPRRAPVDPWSPAVLVASHDVRGHRRLVTLTHRNLVANVLQLRLWIPDVQAGREVVLCLSPATTAAGMVGGVLLAALAAATLVVPTAGAGPPRTVDPTLLLGDRDELAGLVAAAEEGEVDLASLRAGLVAGDAPTDEVAARLRRVSGQARVRRAFGVPEATFLTHANPVYGRGDPRHVGLPVTGTAATVVDEDDPTVVVAEGRPGRLVVAGPQVMAGYWQDRGATEAVLDDGWLLTDHRAVRDATGVFAIVGVVGDTVPDEPVP